MILNGDGGRHKPARCARHADSMELEGIYSWISVGRVCLRKSQILECKSIYAMCVRSIRLEYVFSLLIFVLFHIEYMRKIIYNQFKRIKSKSTCDFLTYVL
jgi:hypothetical protein